MTKEDLKEKSYFDPQHHTEEDCNDFEFTGQCENVEHYTHD